MSISDEAEFEDGEMDDSAGDMNGTANDQNGDDDDDDDDDDDVNNGSRGRRRSRGKVNYKEDDGNDEEDDEDEEFDEDQEEEEEEDDDEDDDEEDDIPLAALKSPSPAKKKKPKTSGTNGNKVKAPAKKKAKTTASSSSAKKKKKKTVTIATNSSSGSSSDYSSPSFALYGSDSNKGKLIQKLLCRWWYAITWPDPSSIPDKPPLNHDAMDGFPGVYVCTQGEDVGTINDLRDKTKAPNFINFAKKSSEELRNLLVKAIKEQKRQLIEAEGEGTDTEKELNTMLKWAEKLNTQKADKEAATILKANKLTLPE